MTRDNVIEFCYLVSAVCFILALKGLSSPKTARYGNMIGAAGMVLAVAVTFALPGMRAVNVPLILVGAIIILGTSHSVGQTILGFIGVILAMLNAVGGFLVTDRMLEMFKSKRSSAPVATASSNGQGVRHEGLNR